MSRGALALLVVVASLALVAPRAEGQAPSPSTADSAASGIVSADSQIAPPAQSLDPEQDEPPVDDTGVARSDGDTGVRSDGGEVGEPVGGNAGARAR